MKPISFAEFDQIHQDAVRVVSAHWTVEMQTELARHCHGWLPGLFDFEAYLTASSVRFYKAYCALTKSDSSRRVCDVGGFWGVWPITLRALGYEVAMTETLQYYGSSFQALFTCMVERGIRIFDYDPFSSGTVLSEKFDFVTVMAVLEHYPHSLRVFMNNVIRLLQPDGRIYLEVPNIAYFPKRLGLLLLGRNPNAALSDIYDSEIPFIGHHHEFTISELRDLARLSGLSILSEDFYNYSLSCQPLWKRLLKYAVQLPAFVLLKDSRECLAVLCKIKN